MEHYTMNTKEINQISVFEKLKKKELSQEVAAQALKLTARQIRNKMKRFCKEGPKGLIHKRRGTIGNRAWNKEIRKKAITIIKEHYYDFGPTFAAEKLEQNHGIFINRQSLRKAMIKEGIWQGKKRKAEHRRLRERKSTFGNMIQLDGSNHDWLEGRGERCTVLVFIDDATSAIVWAKFVTGESVENVMSASYEYFTKCGLPDSLYVDNGSVFKVNTNNPDHTKITQYERAVGELGIDIIHARSSQAKGRVERAHQTLQDRLVKELRLNNIATMEDANKFLQEKYLPVHNAKFSLPAITVGDAHRPIDGYNLDYILSIKEKRVLANDFTISYRKRLLQVEPTSTVILRPKDSITVLKLLNNSLVLLLRGKKLNFSEIRERPSKPAAPKVYSDSYHKPTFNHPWRNYLRKENSKYPKSTQMEVIAGV